MKLLFPPEGAKRVVGAAIELVSGRVPDRRFKSALFDFDGTISVIRQGWQQVMAPLMIEELMKTGTVESQEELASTVRELIDRTTGKETIYQMMDLATEIEKRGAKPLDPYEYKQIYIDRLWEKIKDRVAGLKAGKIRREDMVIQGAIELLDALKARGLELYLASGTDHSYVIDEAAALGIDRYFGDNIYGAIDRCAEHSKARIIQGIIDSHGLGGDSLLVFGDGFVEIENCRAAGGFAVGVASDEINRCGLDDWKRTRLISAGADIIVTDFRDCNALVEYLLG